MSLPERVRRSTPSVSAGTGTRPTAPTASTWTGTLAACVTRAGSAMGCTVPISSLAAPMGTSAGWVRGAPPPAPTPLPRLPDKEPVDRPGARDLQELVPGALRPDPHVGIGAGVVREHLEDLSQHHLPHRLARLDDGHRTEKADAVNVLVRIDDFGPLRHDALPYPSARDAVKVDRP